MIAQKKLEYGQVRCRGPPSCYWTKVFKLTNNNKEYNMTKYEMICKIKEEIKTTSEILRINKRTHKQNQRMYSQGTRPFELIQLYPFVVEKVTPFNHNYVKVIDGKHYWNYSYNETPCNAGIESAKCHLTCLHIMYNMLRTKKTHCHNIERNDYYVKYFDKLIQGYLSQVEEEQNVVV